MGVLTPFLTTAFVWRIRLAHASASFQQLTDYEINLEEAPRLRKKQ
jgi:hypothetical protein